MLTQSVTSLCVLFIARSERYHHVSSYDLDIIVVAKEDLSNTLIQVGRYIGLLKPLNLVEWRVIEVFTDLHKLVHPLFHCLSDNEGMFWQSSFVI